MNKAKSLARLRVVNDEGDLYAAASADGLWIKLGFSTCRMKDEKAARRGFNRLVGGEGEA